MNESLAIFFSSATFFFLSSASVKCDVVDTLCGTSAALKTSSLGIG